YNNVMTRNAAAAVMLLKFDAVVNRRFYFLLKFQGTVGNVSNRLMLLKGASSDGILRLDLL
ncbi:MAG: hypothetical protein KJ930_18165, partial [Gammaproteobacteria bacterium]|nr:hypothetical protein [Gammaproteobacteria bacterium]